MKVAKDTIALIVGGINMARILPPSVFKANFEAAEFKPTQTQRVAERFATPEGLKLGVNIVDQAGGTIRDAVTQYARKRALIAAKKDPSQYSYETGMGEVIKATTPEARAAGYETMRKAFDRPGSGRLLGDPTRAPSRLMRQDYEALAKASPIPKDPGPGKAPAFFPQTDDDLAASKQLGASFDRAVSVRRALSDANGVFQAVDLTKTIPPDLRLKLIQSGAYEAHTLQDENGQQIQTVRLRTTPDQKAEIDAARASGAESSALARNIRESNFARGLALMNNAGSANLNTAYKNFQVYQNTLARLQGFRQAQATPENIKEVNRLRDLLNQTGVQTFRGSSLGNFLQNYQPRKPDPGETTGDGKAKGTGQGDVTGGPSTPVGSLVEAAKGFSDEEKQELAVIVSEKGVNSKEYKEAADKIKRRKLAVAEMGEADTEGLRSKPDLLTAKPSLAAPGPTYLDDAEFFAGKFLENEAANEAALQAVYPEEKRNLQRATDLKTRLTDPKNEAFIPRDPDAADRAIATRLPGYQSFSKTNRPKRPIKEMRKETDARTLAARRRLTTQMAESAGAVRPVAPLAPPQAVASGSQPFKAGSLTRAQVIKMATIPRSKGKDLVPNDDRVNDLMADLARGELFKPNPNPKGEKIGGTPKLKAMAKKAAKKHGVPEALFLALINKESRFRPSSVSHMNAIGIAQMLPTTFRDTMGKNAKASDLFKPEVALDASAKHMARLIKKFKGSKDGMKKAIAAYNAGEGNVRRRGLYGFQMVKNKKTGKPYKLYGVLEPQFASGQTKDYLFNKELGIYNAYKASLPKPKKKKDIADKPGPKAPKEGS